MTTRMRKMLATMKREVDRIAHLPTAWPAVASGAPRAATTQARPLYLAASRRDAPATEASDNKKKMIGPSTLTNSSSSKGRTASGPRGSASSKGDSELDRLSVMLASSGKNESASSWPAASLSFVSLSHRSPRSSSNPSHCINFQVSTKRRRRHWTTSRCSWRKVTTKTW